MQDIFRVVRTRKIVDSQDELQIAANEVITELDAKGYTLHAHSLAIMGSTLYSTLHFKHKQ